MNTNLLRMLEYRFYLNFKIAVAGRGFNHKLISAHSVVLVINLVHFGPLF